MPVRPWLYAVCVGLLGLTVGCGAANEAEAPVAAPPADPATPPPASTGRAEDAAQPGEFRLERPTLICLGAWWLVAGDQNHNTKITFEYRAVGSEPWLSGPDFFRVDSAGLPEDIDPGWAPPKGQTLYAGSIFELHPDTEYELRFTLVDPDGGGAVKTVRQRTRPVPQVAADARKVYVVPGNGGGDGSEGHPYRGLTEANAHAQPGDLMLLSKGVYTGTFTVDKSGEPGKPIVYRGLGARGEVVLDGKGNARQLPGRTISATDIHDVWFENLDVINADFAIVCHRSSRIVVRGCHIYKTTSGFTATVNPNKGVMEDNYIADNLFESDCTWPRTKGIEENEGVQVGGEGTVVCYNTFRGHADAISTYQHTHCCAIDFYGNDIDVETDDGIEMDYSLRNTRCFRNRLTNCFQGISVQPIYGGPTYIFRNVMYNIEVEPFKLHNSPSGVLLYHNTVVKAGPPITAMTPQPINNIVMRNNLYLGGKSVYGFEFEVPAVRCDVDHDGIDGQFENFLKWNGKRYTPMDGKTPAEAHAVRVQAAGCFANKAPVPADPKKQARVQVNDLRLAADSTAIDQGVPLKWFTAHAAGKGPDLGAYELGDPLPVYGVRPAGNSTEEYAPLAANSTPAANPPTAP